jgi:hypothetical protein
VVFLVEGDALRFAHEGELDVDTVEELRGQECGVGCACRDGGELGPVLGNESGVVDAKVRIEGRAGVNEVEETLLFGTHRPKVFLEALEEAHGFVFVVEFVGNFGDRGSAEKVYWFLEASFESRFDVIGQGDTFVAGSDFCERAEAFAEPEGEGFGSWSFAVSGFALLFGFHVRSANQVDCASFQM